MSKSKIRQLTVRRKRLQKQICKHLALCLPGQLTHAFLTCNRGNCKCTQGHPHGPAWRLTWKEQSKTRISYVRLSEVTEAKKGVAHTKKVHVLLRKIAFINLELLKSRRDE